MGFQEDINVIKNRGDLFGTQEYICQITKLRKLIHDQACSLADRLDMKSLLKENIKVQIRASAKDLGICSERVLLEFLCADVGVLYELVFDQSTTF